MSIMKTKKFVRLIAWLFLFSFLTVSAFPLAGAQLECAVRQNIPFCLAGEIPVFRISNTNNAHAEIIGPNNYIHTVCCKATGGGTLGTDCAAVVKAEVLKLSADTNAHVGNPLTSSYPVKVCLSITPPGTEVFCTFNDGGCPGEAPEPLASVSGDTNAHIGNPDAYTKKVCCRVKSADLEAPSVTLTEFLPDPTNDNTPTYQGTATDNIAVQTIEYRIDGGPWQTSGVKPFAPAPTVNFEFTTIPLPDGMRSIQVRASDGSGNFATKVDLLTVDTAPPVTVLSECNGAPCDPGWHFGNVEVEILCVDDPSYGSSSGCNRTFFCNTTSSTGSPPCDPNENVFVYKGGETSFRYTLSEEGDNILYGYSGDNASNDESPKVFGVVSITKTYPVINFVNDTPTGPADLRDVDVITDTGSFTVVWNATVEGETTQIIAYQIFLFNESGAHIATPVSWANIAPTRSVLMKNVITYPFEVDKYYNVTVRVWDNVGRGRSADKSSDGFRVKPCYDMPCGSPCAIGGSAGVCNGTGGGSLDCYITGGCYLRCLVPTATRVDIRKFFDNDNNPVTDAVFSLNTNLYCGRTNATKCGPTSLCNQSMIAGQCIADTSIKPGIQITGGWNKYIPPISGEFYGPNKPFNITIEGISLSLAVPERFQPILECKFKPLTAAGNVIFYRWGKKDAKLVFDNYSLYPNTQWNLTGCYLWSDIPSRGDTGWVIYKNDTPYTFGVDSEKPNVTITGPPAGMKVGKRFNVAFRGIDSYAGIDHYEIQYDTRLGVISRRGGFANSGKTTKDYYEISPSSPELPSCYRVRAVDRANNTGNWTWNESGKDSLDLCNCSPVNFLAPTDLKVYTPARIDKRPSAGTEIYVNWSATDAKCYEVWYNATSLDGKAVKNWTPWNAILVEMKDVFVWNATIGYEDGFFVNCTTKNGSIFKPLSVIGDDPNDVVYNFSVRAVANVTGLAKISLWNFNSTVVQTEEPRVTSNATRGGELIESGGSIYAGEAVLFSANATPKNLGGSEITNTWITWDARSAFTGEPKGGGAINCGDASDPTKYSSRCEGVGGPWCEDLNITYQGFAKDTGTPPNLGRDKPKYFMVWKNLSLATSIRDLYLILGSYEYVTMHITNRRGWTEKINMTILDDYRYSKFAETPGLTLSTDKRTANFTLNPMEEKTVNIMVYTADIGGSNMTVYANSTIPGHGDINDAMRIKIMVVFPAEFSELSFAAVLLLFVIAALAYMKLSRD